MTPRLTVLRAIRTNMAAVDGGVVDADAVAVAANVGAVVCSSRYHDIVSNGLAVKNAILRCTKAAQESRWL